MSAAGGLDPRWRALRRRLEGLRASIVEEIGRYPPPITACDAQFDFLLEERDRLARELARLEALHSSALNPAKAEAAIADFLRSSPDIDDAAAARIEGDGDEP